MPEEVEPDRLNAIDADSAVRPRLRFRPPGPNENVSTTGARDWNRIGPSGRLNELPPGAYAPSPAAIGTPTGSRKKLSTGNAFARAKAWVLSVKADPTEPIVTARTGPENRSVVSWEAVSVRSSSDSVAENFPPKRAIVFFAEPTRKSAAPSSRLTGDASSNVICIAPFGEFTVRETFPPVLFSENVMPDGALRSKPFRPTTSTPVPPTSRAVNVPATPVLRRANPPSACES